MCLNGGRRYIHPGILNDATLSTDQLDIILFQRDVILFRIDFVVSINKFLW